MDEVEEDWGKEVAAEQKLTYNPNLANKKKAVSGLDLCIHGPRKYDGRSWELSAYVVTY